MTIRRFVMPTVLAMVLVVGLFTATAFAQDPDAHTPSPDQEEEVDVAGVVIEREPTDEESGTPAGTPVDTEVLGVTIANTNVASTNLASTGTDAFLLAAIGVGLVALGVLAFGVGRWTSTREGPTPAR